MKILGKILMFVLPALLIVNLYRFYFMNETYTYSGVKDFFEYVATFNGLSNTINTINGFNESIHAFEEAGDFIETITKIWEAIRSFFNIIVGIVKDIISNIMWLFGWLGIN